MDGERFDHLTRRLAESLPRRRLLRSAAGTLIGVVLAGRARVVKAETCEECQARGLACCSHLGTPFCRAANQTCCGPIICAEGFACVGGFCVACPPEKKCGSRCCNDGQTCENEECVVACPSGTTRCGETNCCGDGQSCDNGQCVDACPVGIAAQRDGGRRSRRREVTAEACEPEPPPPCPSGTVKCRGACVPACTGKSSLDGNTCKCSRKKCPDGKLKCDGKCIDPQTDRTHCGGCASADGASCGAGPCCQGQCQAGGSTCCGAQVCSAGEACCGQPKKCCPASQCCGPGCCPDGQYCARSNAKVGLCCPNGQQDCNSGCCAPGEVCASFRKSVCCPQDRPRYCAKTSQCVENRKACK
jgi:hypothetical protein